ncbi:MAG: hypothetical protein ACQEP2_07510 [Actinomycetota bacterium]
MNKKVIENITIALIVLILFLLVAFNIYRVETYKFEQKRLEEEQDRIDKLEKELKAQREELRQEKLEELKKDKENKVAEIIDFHHEYMALRESFLLKIENLSFNSDNKFENIGEIRDKTQERIEASKEFKEEFENIGYAPEPLEFFYNSTLDFLTMDLKYWLLVDVYYNSESYSLYETGEIDKLQEQVSALFAKSEEELARVYRKYDLGGLMEDLS